MSFTRLHRFCAGILVACSAALFIPATAGAWTVLTQRPGDNTDEVAMVRSPGGMLHVAYRERQGDVRRIKSRSLALGGGAWSTPSTVVDDWISMTNPDLEVIGGTLYAFWAGQGSIAPGDPTSTGRSWYAQRTGGTWSGATVHSMLQSPSASSQISSAVASDGATPWITWTATSALVTHEGLPQGGPETNHSRGCCEYASNIGRDAATGDLYLVWFQNITNHQGVYSRRIDPAVGAVVQLPDAAPAASFSGRSNRLAATPRTTGGVYTAYCDTYPSCTHVRVAGTSGPGLRHRTFAGGANPSKVWAAAGPNGRMWLLWGDNSGQTYAVRSNRALTAWGRTLSIGAPARTPTTWSLAAEGSRGPLDVVMNATVGGNIRVYHRRVLPPLDLRLVSVTNLTGGRHLVRLRATDAGDGIVASVAFRGAVRATNSAGAISFVVPGTVPPGGATARVSRAGYVPDTVAVRWS